MTTRNIRQNALAADLSVTASSNDIVNIFAGVTVAATGTSPNVTAVFSGGSNVTVNVSGAVSGATGIRLGDNPLADSSQLVNVRATGLVVGDIAVRMNGLGSEFTNAGQVFGTITGITLAANGAGTSTIVNSGTIAGQSAAILLDTAGGQAVTIRNSGSILCLKDDGLAIFANGTLGGPIRLVNSGRIDGDIELGAGNDRFEGSTGRVEGLISGNGGNDRFILGTRAERIDGGDGVDTVAITGRTGARIALDNDAANGGRAKGDTFANIENAVGSSRGGDVIRGSAAANVLDGQGGRDRLSGLGGDDTLVGGSGVDTLSGGAGDDVFQFRSAAQGGDVITDFRGSAGNNDSFRFDDAGFGGIATGALDEELFVTRADRNRAIEADDRFVFRNSDATLWYDADGSGDARPVLIADLQAGAVVTAADILIF